MSTPKKAPKIEDRFVSGGMEVGDGLVALPYLLGSKAATGRAMRIGHEYLVKLRDNPTLPCSLGHGLPQARADGMHECTICGAVGPAVLQEGGAR